MPSRTNRIRNRRGLNPNEDGSSDDDNGSGVGLKEKRARRNDAVASPPPPSYGLKRLLAILALTTLLLTGYHLYRLKSKGTGLLSSRIGSSVVEESQGKQHIAPPSIADIVRDSQVPGGMMVRPGGDADAEDASQLKIEDLDMDTLQAAFDALYGDGGPLAPKRGRGGEDGQYSHVFRKKGGAEEAAE